MAALKSVAIAVALLAAAPARAESVADWHTFIAEVSARFGVPIAWIERVMQAESAGRTTLNGRPITSRAGAMGLMQLMPATWSAMRAAWRLGADPYDPHDNIIAGTAYLRAMYDRFGYPGLFGAYNAGPGRYGRYLANGRALPNETRHYLAAVTGVVQLSPLPRPAPPPATLFVALRGTAPLPQSAQPNRPVPGLFVTLSPP